MPPIGKSETPPQEGFSIDLEREKRMVLFDVEFPAGLMFPATNATRILHHDH